MKVFKKIIAGVVAGTLVLAMATSAFAATATVSNEGVVTPSGFTAVSSGNMTVMVVNAAAYDLGTIEADDICYIDQFAYSEAATKLASLASRNLKYGNYYVVVGSTVGVTQKSEVVGSINVGEQYATISEQSGRDVIAWNVTVKAQLQSGLTAQLFNTVTEESTTPVELEWEEGIITGEGDVSFEVVTEVNEGNESATELEIASGEVSNRN